MATRLATLVQRAWLPLFVVLSLGFLVSYLLRSAHEFHQPLKFSLPLLLATIVSSVLYWALAVTIWRQVVSLISSAHLSRLDSLMHLVMVTLGKYMPGKVWGMIARGAQLTRHGATSGEAAFATYYEQYILLHASVILSCLLALILWPAAGFTSAVLAALLIAIIGIRLRETGINVFFYLLKRFGRGDQVKPKHVHTRAYSELLAQFILLWLLNSAILVGLYFTFFESSVTSHLILILSLANIAGLSLGFFAVFAPGGIGVREAVISAVLATVMPLGDAVLLSVLYRLWVILSELVAGLAVLITRKARLS